ncbi:unnamed protein product, partial [Brenthis ino]
MSLVTICYRFVLANVITLVTAVFGCLHIIFNILKNPFKNPWPTRLKLEPPVVLSDPKYGVHKYIKANSVKLHYVESGDPSKPLMLFIHGFPEFWYAWRHQIVEFNKEYRCVAVDMRGYGDSERPEGVQHYKIQLLVDDIKDLIHQLGYEKCILVSHDWGGVIACKLRDTYPDVLHALVVLSSASPNVWCRQIWSTSEQRIKSWYTFFFRFPKLPELMLQMNDLEFLEIALEKNAGKVSDEDIECYKYWFGKQTGLTPPVNYYRANFMYSWTEQKHDENIPFLFAHGENEKYLSRSILDVMKEEYVNIETVILEDDTLLVSLYCVEFRMSLTIQQIILDAKRLAGRLKERETEADALLTETQTAYRQIYTIKQYKEEVDTLNEASRERPRGELIASMERESRLMRDVQRENGELRAALEDHRQALEFIMSKYRQHTEKRVWESRIDFTAAINEKQQELIRQQAERINEMTSIMYKAVNMDENGETRKEEELYQRLITENKGLREMLNLSRRYGSDKSYGPPMEDKDVQTDGPPLSGA